MFDDFILLAKGGLTVYHGPTKKVEEYFSGIGIVVPDRVTPPDHYIDILEGIIKPSNNMTHEELPVRWMLHNGYPLHKDQVHLNFLQSKDLSNRRNPSILRQYRYYLGRVTKQRLREARLQAADLLILLLAGACLGTLAKVDDETFGSTGYTYTVIAVCKLTIDKISLSGWYVQVSFYSENFQNLVESNIELSKLLFLHAALLCMISALRSFSLDKLHYMRESASGISSLAYFLSKDTLDLFNTILKPLVYLSMFYFFNSPRSTFEDNYVVLLCLVYCVTGLAYIFAIYLEPSSAQLVRSS
ncbi:unnamed protein product [Linum tenue]|uniref:ABC transporter family G domain-containing protein n=1 Tax=Linum tenue TaxID=586396 RepID=A0AAV0PM17_9ROSI|nr:unnamed protein product [Linum tenue]